MSKFGSDAGKLECSLEVAFTFAHLPDSPFWRRALFYLQTMVLTGSRLEILQAKANTSKLGNFMVGG